MVKATKKSNESIAHYTKKTEFWLGLATIFVVAAIGGVFAFKNSSTTPVSTKKEAVQVKNTRPTMAPTPTNSIKKVSVLANTSGETPLTVIEGDNFWKISVRACGVGNYYRSIQAYNGYSDEDTLHSGDVLVIVCQE